MIVTCPNCGARYRLATEVVARRSRLKCAECAHRWVPDEDVDEDEAVAEVQAELRAPPPSPPIAVAPEPLASPANPDPAPMPQPVPRPAALKNIVAIVLGLAFATAAAGLWVGQADPAGVPLIGDRLAAFAATSSALKIDVAADVSTVRGKRVLDLKGRLTNPTRTSQPVPLLKARLYGDAGTARRWTISPPVVRLGPGESIGFTSNVTDVPAGADRIGITPAR